MRLLIIEDNEDVAGNVGDYLEARGDVVDFAYDGLGGLHLAVTQTYDAIVLGNLVGNAFRRTLQGAVSISWREDRIEVTDTGPGIPEELVATAAERHVAGEQGHGLGLSIVTALCDRYGWDLHIDSGQGAGTRAIVSV